MFFFKFISHLLFNVLVVGGGYDSDQLSMQQDTDQEAKSRQVVERVSVLRFQISSFGRYQVKSDEVHQINYPEFLSVFRDKKFTESLDLKSNVVSDINKGFKEIEQNWRSLSVNSFDEKCAALEKTIVDALARGQLQQCENSQLAGQFYRNGMVRFAESQGLPAEEIKILRFRAFESRQELERVNREIEAKAFSRLFELLSKEKARSLSAVYETPTPKRHGALSTIWIGLSELENKERQTKAEPNRFPQFFITNTGYLDEATRLEINNLIELRSLIACQDWEVTNDVSVKVYLQTLTDKFLAIERQFSEKEDEILEQAKNSRLSKSETAKRISEASDDTKKEKEILIREIESLLNDEEQSILKHAKLMLQLQREGPSKELFTGKTFRKLGYQLSDSDIDAFSKGAKRVREQLEKDCLNVQERFILKLFAGLSTQKGSLDWIHQEYRYGLPPIDILLVDCEKSALAPASGGPGELEIDR